MNLKDLKNFITYQIDDRINNEIIFCYMNDNLDRDLSIEIIGNSKGMMAI